MHIPTDLHQFIIRSLPVFARTDKRTHTATYRHTDTQTDADKNNVYFASMVGVQVINR